jgi:HSP20 family protein
MAITRREEAFPTNWNPWRELQEMSNRMEHMFGRFRGGNGEESLATGTGWAPRVNVSENDNEYLVSAELPAVDKKDVHVKMQDNILTIDGERKQQKEEKGERYHRVESFYGTFFRRFTMPEDADAEKIVANLDNGLLTVHIAKLPAKKQNVREISIK